MKTVCLKLAKDLKEAGYPQLESDFYWWGNKIETEINCVHKSQILDDRIIELGIRKKEYCAAPTVDEILDLLPIDITGDEGMRFDINIYRELSFGRWVIGYWWDEDSRRKSNMTIENMAENTLADTAAKMWLYLKKHELLNTT